MDTTRVEDLLKKIHATVDIDPKWKGTTDTIKAFSEFLGELANQADITTKENLKLQAKMVHLTWALFFLTFALTIVAAIQMYFIFSERF